MSDNSPTIVTPGRAEAANPGSSSISKSVSALRTGDGFQVPRRARLRNDGIFSGTRGRQRGITLIELLVVLSILALISALVVVNVLPARDKAASDKAKIDIGTIENALDQYRLDMFNYPTTEQGLAALVTVPPGEERVEQYRPGGYLRAVPVDPWGRPYQYRQPGEHGVFDVFSLGADGEEGGEGVNADIVNWSEET